MSPVFCLKLQVETPPNPNHILQIKNGTWSFLRGRFFSLHPLLKSMFTSNAVLLLSRDPLNSSLKQIANSF